MLSWMVNKYVQFVKYNLFIVLMSKNSKKKSKERKSIYIVPFTRQA